MSSVATTTRPPATMPETIKNKRPFGQITAARKVFGANAKGAGGTIALEGVTYAIQEGDLVALLGPSGCGKTTLLRMVAGLSRPTSGSITIRGAEVVGPQDDFGFVFQTPNLLPWRTVMGNVLFPMEIKGRLDRAARDRAMELLELVGLGGFARSRPHELSGGMKQRVALCRALIHKPSLILMDEPFGALDELTRMGMHDLLLDIRRVSNATVLFVTHSISEAVYLADDVLVFSARPGRVVDTIHIDIPYPRTQEVRFSGAFTEHERRASEGLGVFRPHG